MKKFDIYELLSVVADALGRKKESEKTERATAHTREKAAGANFPKSPFADKKTAIEMIRRHDELSRAISENADKK